MKFFRFFLCTLLILSLVGCRKTPNVPADSVSGDGYLYSSHSGVLYKYNIETGIALPVCQDPVCEHNYIKCPFWGADENIYEIDGSILYFRGSQIRRYDLSDGTWELLYKSKDTMHEPRYAFGRVYFSTVSFAQGSDDIEIRLWAYDLKEDTAKRLTDETFHSIHYVMLAEDDTLVWDAVEGKYYRTDADYQNREDLDKVYGIRSGNLAYRLEVADHKKETYNLYRMDEDGNKVVALENISSAFKGTPEYLYACYNRETPKVIGQKKDEKGRISDYLEYQSNEIYRFNPDGSGKTLLCTLPEEYTIHSIAPDSYVLTEGDYIGVLLKEYERDEEGYILGYYYNAIVDIAIVNVKTGEYKITRSQ